ncbi:PP2C family protein-serine/threonine phosphatase [Leifsonia sp. Leaf264]|uniref:PP2C family protein-serine/threonine phosphatase n=1 Tax=Leifsonia sp. Leaf264 TaxID=1736314 RepID=UPI0006F7BC70|nr:protein phosphatase 2C domain-containing protein [Leifsonia sp. Leaf264]KQO96859.1 serine/threonine protein phosphatase [Leifsonia sp. Leaf264]
MTASVQRVVVNVAAVTDRGQKRQANEDSVLAERPIFLVADGMGGYDAGDLASQAVVAAFREFITGGEMTTLDEVRDALGAADEAVDTVSAGTRRGAGSTVAGIAIVEHDGRPHWLVFNVGDSRVYRHVGSELEQITVDHSLGQELVDQGRMRQDELATFDKRNVITRAIGAPDSTADSWLMPVTNGERLLICSDGLTSEVNDEAIRATLTMSGGPDSAAEALVQRANRAGGRDNITVIVLDVVSGGATGEPTDTTGARLTGSGLTDSMIDDTTIPVRSGV